MGIIWLCFIITKCVCITFPWKREKSLMNKNWLLLIDRKYSLELWIVNCNLIWMNQYFQMITMPFKLYICVTHEELSVLRIFKCNHYALFIANLIQNHFISWNINSTNSKAWIYDTISSNDLLLTGSKKRCTTEHSGSLLYVV